MNVLINRIKRKTISQGALTKRSKCQRFCYTHKDKTAMSIKMTSSQQKLQAQRLV